MPISSGDPVEITVLPGSHESLLVTIISSLTEKKHIMVMVNPGNGGRDVPARIMIWEIFATKYDTHDYVLVANGETEAGPLPAGRVLIRYFVESGKAEMSRAVQ